MKSALNSNSFAIRTMRKTRNLARKGFTLMEIMIVIVLVGIIATKSYQAMAGAKGKAETTKQVNLTTNIEDAKQRYSYDNVGVGGTTPTFAQLQPYVAVAGGTVSSIGQLADPTLNKVGLPITSWGTYPDGNGAGGTTITWGTLNATPVSN